MIPPTDAIGTIIRLVALGKEIRSRYEIYTRADEELRRLDSRISSSIMILGVFQETIVRGSKVLLRQQQEDVYGLIDSLQGIFDRCIPGSGSFNRPH